MLRKVLHAQSLIAEKNVLIDCIRRRTRAFVQLVLVATTATTRAKHTIIMIAMIGDNSILYEQGQQTCTVTKKQKKARVRQK